ncbi:MAG: hypothetical protein OEV59_02455 [Deltaproteobacteria bacterium]|nr:hypothetical protein [Deltaproteobacteria bacterium]
MTEKTDDLPLKLAAAWITEYVELRKNSEETARLLKERADDFETIPVPRSLIRELCIEHGIKEDLPVPVPETKRAAMEALVIKLGSYLEKGDSLGIQRLLTKDYKDANGRTASEIKKAFADFFKSTAKRRFIPVETHIESARQGSYTVIVRGAWEAAAKGENNGPTREFFTLVLTLKDQKTGGPKVSDIKNGF